MATFDETHFLIDVHLNREKVKSFEQYPFSLPAVRALDTLVLHPKVTFLIGENGSGKSTLLEAVAVELGLNPEGGSRNFNFATRRKKTYSELHKFIRLNRGLRRPRDHYFLRAESYFNLATRLEKLDQPPVTPGNPKITPVYGGRSLHEQSHGESFFALFENRFLGNGLYLLDEPEAALSPMKQMAFLSILHRQVGTGSQFLIATHSPIIMAYPDAWIYVLGGAQNQKVEYRETEHYKTMRSFLLQPERMLSILLAE